MAFKSAAVSFGSVRPKPPLVGAGQRIGLLGGSFNPPHAAHRLITHTALRRVGLDAVWWVVSPGNPLKSHGDLAPLEKRLTLCEEMAAVDPRIKVTSFEADLPSAYTAATLSFLSLRYPEVHFVWLMGADNLVTFHHWQHWRDIASTMPMVIVDRPNWRHKALAGPAGRWLAPHFINEERAHLLPSLTPPAWTLLTGRLSNLSSTAIRAAHRKTPTL